MEKELEMVLKLLGIKIGHFTNKEDLTGATCFIMDDYAEIGIDVRGSDTGTINIPAFQPKAIESCVKGIVLTGGSTFGLECSIGVMDYLKTPNVVGAVIYDRMVGNDVRPKLQDGINMAHGASYSNIEQGNIGVGTGATTGKWEFGKHIKGGFGISFKEIKKGAFVCAFVVTNCLGDVVNPKNGEFYSKCGGYENNCISQNYNREETNTTLAVIATNIRMSREQLTKISELAHDGMARAIYPVHTSLDGDVIFSLSTINNNSIKLDMNIDDLINYVGLSASNILIEAINNSISNAESINDYPALKSMR